MTAPDSKTQLEEQIDQWRSFLRRRQAIHSVDVAELEDNLREQVAGLVEAGLATDEAFLVAVKRMGNLDALSREFAREHSERLWKQLVAGGSDSADTKERGGKDGIVAFCLACAAGLLVKVPALFGFSMDGDEATYLRNGSISVGLLLTGYFAWKRRLDVRTVRWLPVFFVAASLLANLYPFSRLSSTGLLTALHLPIALWMVVGFAYAGGRWNQSGGRMDFIRFTGELFIYYVLIALGGGVFTAFMINIFNAIGINAQPVFAQWILPCGAAGAVLIASRLVEAKQSVIENMAPVLTRIFTPLFALMLITFLSAVLWTGRGVDVGRDMLIGFDLLLLVILGLLLYSLSARDPLARPGVFDMIQVLLVISALLADALALWAISRRISDFGFSPNRVAALGENVILLVNLAWSAVLYIRILRGRGSFTFLEKWQTDYLPVYGAWAAIVVIVFPPLFRYI